MFRSTSVTINPIVATLRPKITLELQISIRTPHYVRAAGMEFVRCRPFASSSAWMRRDISHNKREKADRPVVGSERFSLTDGRYNIRASTIVAKEKIRSPERRIISQVSVAHPSLSPVWSGCVERRMSKSWKLSDLEKKKKKVGMTIFYKLGLCRLQKTSQGLV